MSKCANRAHHGFAPADALTSGIYLAGVVNTMWPSAWVMAGPSARYRTVQEVAQWITMVRAVASVATSKSPARTPALISSAPGSRRMLFVPGCRLPRDYRSAR